MRELRARRCRRRRSWRTCGCRRRRARARTWARPGCRRSGRRACSGGYFLIWPGWMRRPVGEVEVAEVLRDFGGVVDRAADERDLAAVLVGELHRDADAMDGRREAGEEELLRVRAKMSSRRGGRRARRACSRGGRRWWSPAGGRGRLLCRVRRRPGDRRDWPSGEERSILKSPVWRTMPSGRVDGERDAVDQRVRDADGMMVNGPSVKRRPGRISISSASSSRRCSSSLPST